MGEERTYVEAEVGEGWQEYANGTLGPDVMLQLLYMADTPYFWTPSQSIPITRVVLKTEGAEIGLDRVPNMSWCGCSAPPSRPASLAPSSRRSLSSSLHLSEATTGAAQLLPTRFHVETGSPGHATLRAPTRPSITLLLEGIRTAQLPAQPGATDATSARVAGSRALPAAQRIRRQSSSVDVVRQLLPDCEHIRTYGTVICGCQGSDSE